MGPFAGARFLEILLEKSARNFGAKNGEDFPEIILDSVPVPDFISDTSRLAQSRKMLILRVKKLAKMGCNPIAMVCNTGHILFPILSKASGNKMISLIEAVRDNVVSRGFKRVGLLATKTTIKSGLYSKAFLNTDIELVNPGIKLQDFCEVIIRDIIANNSHPERFKKLSLLTKRFIQKEKLDAVILGCTELPLAFTENKSVNIIDCLEVLSGVLLRKTFESSRQVQTNY